MADILLMSSTWILALVVVIEAALLVWMAMRLRAAGAAKDRLAYDAASMHDELRRSVQGTAEVLRSIAAGDLSQRVDVQSAGELAQLGAHVNQTVDFLATFSQQQNRLIQRANAGDFGERFDTAGLHGYQGELATGLNQLVQSMESFIGQCAEALGAVAKGDLTQQITKDYPGRFDDLKRETNATAQQLAHIVGRIRESSDAIQKSSHALARANADLSARTEEQGAALASTARSVADLTSAVKQNAENATTANELSHAASKKAAEGGDVVMQVVSTMDGISESSHKIADIIGVIQDIAFQTNLLALNAAVEAARAGEQGRGFAVVASEVRELAGRTATAAKEIKELISASVERVEKGSTLVAKAGSTMEEIVKSTANVTDVVQRIADATQEQSSGIDAVSGTIAQVDQATQQNAAAVEEAAAAAGTMANEARALSESVDVFKLQDGVDRARTVSPRAAADVLQLRPARQAG